MQIGFAHMTRSKTGTGMRRSRDPSLLLPHAQVIVSNAFLNLLRRGRMRNDERGFREGENRIGIQ